MHRQLENFRLLIVLSIVTLVAAVFLTFNQPPPLPEQEDIFSRAGEDALIGFEWANYLWWSWLAVYAGSFVGAFFYAWFTRPLILFAMCFGVVQVPLSGLSVASAWESGVWAVHSTIATFAIGMAFFSPPVIARLRRNWHEAAGHTTRPRDLDAP